jgi:hypothetical protein
MTKTCSRCKEVKDISVFYKKTAYKPKDDGYDYYCKTCRNESAYKTWTTNKLKCTIDGCDKAHYAKSLCKCHYHKKLRREKKVSK